MGSGPSNAVLRDALPSVLVGFGWCWFTSRKLRNGYIIKYDVTVVFVCSNLHLHLYATYRSVSDDRSTTSRIIRSEETDTSNSAASNDEQKVPSSSPIEGNESTESDEAKKTKPEVPSTSCNAKHKLRFKVSKIIIQSEYELNQSHFL